LGHLVNQH
jgi:hypothetical protein